MDRSFWLNSVKILLTFRSYSCVQNTNVTVKQGEGESVGHGYSQNQAQHLKLRVGNVQKSLNSVSKVSMNSKCVSQVCSLLASPYRPMIK